MCLCVPQMMDNKYSKYLGDACVRLQANRKSGVEILSRNFYPFEVAKGQYDLFAEPLFSLDSQLWSVQVITAYLEAVGFIVSSYCFMEFALPSLFS